MALAAFTAFAFTSCELDNYDGPDASISGEALRILKSKE